MPSRSSTPRPVPADLKLLGQVAAIAFCNPFTPERQALERAVAGPAAVPRPPGGGEAMSVSVDGHELGEVLAGVLRAAEGAADRASKAIQSGAVRGTEALRAYEGTSLYLLYKSFESDLTEQARAAAAAGSAARQNPCAGGPPPRRATSGRFTAWARFEAEFDRRLRPGGVTLPSDYQPAPVLACFFQIRRAFDAIYPAILGTSAPAATLRATCWESVFTHDLRAWYDGLAGRMAGFPTLITGPSGTGKELVARAIAASAHLPFDPATGRFATAPPLAAVSLAALPGTLIESELFGHTRGSFTGAVADRDGWLDSCPATGCVFLDEIGDLDPLVQVKLLRVLQERVFTRVGETAERCFAGKIVAATHRDLPADVAAGRFRHDLYFRLCADVVRTPSLAEVLEHQPGDLRVYAVHLAARALGAPGEAAERLADATVAWAAEHLGPHHPWPGNVRELEQSVRGVLIRGHRASPASTAACLQPPGDPSAKTLADLARAGASADAVRAAYVHAVFAIDGTHAGTARRIGLDRRTVKRLLHEEH